MSCRKDRRTTRLHVTLLGGVLLFALAAAQADVNEHQKKRIRAAAPDKARVVPKKPRRGIKSTVVQVSCMYIVVVSMDSCL